MTTPSGTISFSDMNVECLLAFNRPCSLTDDYFDILRRSLTPEMSAARSKTNNDVIAASRSGGLAFGFSSGGTVAAYGTCVAPVTLGRTLRTFESNSVGNINAIFQGDVRGSWWTSFTICRQDTPTYREIFRTSATISPVTGNLNGFGDTEWVLPAGGFALVDGVRYIVVFHP